MKQNMLVWGTKCNLLGVTSQKCEDEPKRQVVWKVEWPFTSGFSNPNILAANFSGVGTEEMGL
jgi:hypothetical protein